MNRPSTVRRALAATALACLAATACAQSGVSIYGIIDIGVSKQNSGTSTLAGGVTGGGPAASRGLASAPANSWTVRQGWASRLGFRGIEDLGGGYKAGFLLEHRFSPDIGSLGVNDPFWGGNSTVSLFGPFGEVYAGRATLPTFVIGLLTDPFDYGYVGTLGRLHAFGNYAAADFASSGNAVTAGVRSNNTVGYRSPSIGGLSGQLAVSASEGGRGALGREVGGNLQYRSGGLYVGLGIDRTTNNGAGQDPQLLILAGLYRIGMWQPMLAYAEVTPTTGSATRVYSAGGKAFIGNGTVKAVYSRLHPDGANNSTTKVGLGYEYALSRRSFLYTNIGSAKNKAYTRTTAVDFGMRHHF